MSKLLLLALGIVAILFGAILFDYIIDVTFGEDYSLNIRSYVWEPIRAALDALAAPFRKLNTAFLMAQVNETLLGIVLLIPVFVGLGLMLYWLLRPGVGAV